MWILTNTTQRFVQHNRDGNASPRWKKKTWLHTSKRWSNLFFKPHVILCSELVGGTPFEFLIPSCPIWLFFRYYHYITSSNYFCYTNLFLGCSNHSCFCLVNVFLYSATFISLYLVCPATHSILGSQQRRSVSHRAQKRRQKGAQKLGPAATLRMDCRPKGLLKWTKSYWNNGVCVWVNAYLVLSHGISWTG